MTKFCKFLTKVILKHILLLAQTSTGSSSDPEALCTSFSNIRAHDGCWHFLLFIFTKLILILFFLKLNRHTHFFTSFLHILRTFNVRNWQPKKFFLQPLSQNCYKVLCVAKWFFFNTITPHTTEIFSHSHTIVVITKINHFLITVDTPAGQNEFFQEKISQWEKIYVK